MRPRLGRLLTPEDRVQGAAPVVVLSYEYWQRLGGDEGIVGEILDLTAKRAEIVGVLAPGSHYATQRKLDFYANYASNDHYSGASMQDDRTHRMTDVFARLAARHYFGEVDPLGRRISYSFGNRYSDEHTVVGIAADTRPTHVEKKGVHALYLPAAQSFAPSTVLVRTAGDPSPVTPLIVESIRSLDPQRPIEHVQTLAELRSESLAPQRLNATLFGAFAGLALLIATIGVAAVIAFSVGARRREMGIRATFGASPGQLLGAVVRDGLWMTGAGLLLGAAAAAVSSRLLAGLLYEVEPLDAATFALVGLALLVVATLASVIPARRASTAQPLEVLRSE